MEPNPWDSKLKNKDILYTLPTAEILSGKNARAWVSMVLYLKKDMKNKKLKQKKKNPGCRLELAC